MERPDLKEPFALPHDTTITYGDMELESHFVLSHLTSSEARRKPQAHIRRVYC